MRVAHFVSTRGHTRQGEAHRATRGVDRLIGADIYFQIGFAECNRVVARRIVLLAREEAERSGEE